MGTAALNDLENCFAFSQVANTGICGETFVDLSDQVALLGQLRLQAKHRVPGLHHALRLALSVIFKQGSELLLLGRFQRVGVFAEDEAEVLLYGRTVLADQLFQSPIVRHGLGQLIFRARILALNCRKCFTQLSHCAR